MSLAFPGTEHAYVSFSDLTLEEFETARLQTTTEYDPAARGAQMVWRERSVTRQVETRRSLADLFTFRTPDSVPVEQKQLALCIILPHARPEMIYEKLDSGRYPSGALSRVDDAIVYLSRVLSRINLLIEEKKRDVKPFIETGYQPSSQLTENRNFLETLIDQEKRLYKTLSRNLPQKQADNIEDKDSV